MDDLDPRAERLLRWITLALGVVLLALILGSGRLALATGVLVAVIGAGIGLLYNVLFARGMRLGLLLLMFGPFVVILTQTSQLLAGICYWAGLVVVGSRPSACAVPLSPRAR